MSDWVWKASNWTIPNIGRYLNVLPVEARILWYFLKCCYEMIGVKIDVWIILGRAKVIEFNKLLRLRNYSEFINFIYFVRLKCFWFAVIIHVICWQYWVCYLLDWKEMYSLIWFTSMRDKASAFLLILPGLYTISYSYCSILMCYMTRRLPYFLDLWPKIATLRACVLS